VLKEMAPEAWNVRTLRGLVLAVLERFAAGPIAVRSQLHGGVSARLRSSVSA